MAIHFISGKPGSGKSLYGVHLLIREIVDGTRNVVTNLPLHPGRLNEYLQLKYPDRDLRLLQRLTVMTELEARQFWQHRGDQTSPVGVMYQLDELHLFFNARDWMQTGRACLHYLSQHRKLGDVVVAITQSVPNVDKQFRSVAEDFTVLRNEYLARYGPFRGRGRFVRKTYLSEPTGGSQQEPFETASFALDAAGIASCYDTAQGIGIHGNAADKGRKPGGWSIWWTIPLGLGLASLAVIIPFFGSKAVSHVMAPAAVAAVAAVSAQPVQNFESVASGSSDLRVVGFVGSFARRSYRAFLSDGSVFSEVDGAVTAAGPGFLVINNRRVYFARPAVVDGRLKSEMVK